MDAVFQLDYIAPTAAKIMFTFVRREGNENKYFMKLYEKS